MHSFLILLLSCALAVSASPSCDEEALKKCDFKLNDDVSFPRDAFELNKQCTEDGPKFSCIADVLKRCPKLTTRNVRNFYLAAEKFIYEICDGNLRVKYLRNAQCFGDIMTSKPNYCADINNDKRSHDICVYQGAVKECVSSAVKDTCGKEAFEILLELYKVTRFLVENPDCP